MSNLFDDRYAEQGPAQQGTREPRHDRDVTLGMGAVLAIFFALVVLCAIFYGVGYQMGRRSGEKSDAPAPAANAAPSTPAYYSGAPKPSASGAQAQPQAQTTVPTDATAPPANAPVVMSSTPAAPVAGSPATSMVQSTPVAKPAPAQTAPAPKPQDAPKQAAPSNTSYMVQVAAVVHDEDAQYLVSSLKKHGYSVVVRHEPQDSLTHVQVGPFSSKDEAKAMQQRLHDDGYAAIIK